jgi:hypothetical protein
MGEYWDRRYIEAEAAKHDTAGLISLHEHWWQRFDPRGLVDEQEHPLDSLNIRGYFSTSERARVIPRLRIASP